MTRVRALAILAVLMALCGGVSGCGSSPSSSSSSSSLSGSASSTSASSTSAASSSATTASATSTPSSTTSGGPPHATVSLARRLERALRRSRATPPVSSATCSLETAAQRSGSPFGASGGSVYACMLTRGATKAAYNVQLLTNGCFVAERRAPGVAIYGCGAGRT